MGWFYVTWRRHIATWMTKHFHHHPPLLLEPNSSIVRQKLLLLLPSGPKLALLLVLVHPRLLALGNSFRISAKLVPRPHSVSLYCIVSLHCFRIFFSHQHILLVKLSSSFINLLEHLQYLIPWIFDCLSWLLATHYVSVCDRCKRLDATRNRRRLVVPARLILEIRSASQLGLHQPERRL